MILIQGVWAGSWVWDRVLEPLCDRGFDVRAVDLPGSGEWAPGARITLDTVARHVLGHLAGLDGPAFAHGGRGDVF